MDWEMSPSSLLVRMYVVSRWNKVWERIDIELIRERAGVAFYFPEPNVGVIEDKMHWYSKLYDTTRDQRWAEDTFDYLQLLVLVLEKQ